MGRGSHLLARRVGGCDSGQRFASPGEETWTRVNLRFFGFGLFLGWALSSCWPRLCPFAFGFDLLRVFLVLVRLLFSSAHNTGM